MYRQTTLAKPGSFEPKWHLIDATEKPLGRLASRIAVILMGKHLPRYTTYVDTGDFVVVVNAAKIKLTGRKAERDSHQFYSRHPGGQKSVTFGAMLEKHPEQLLELAVRRMLPKSQLGQDMLRKMKVYRGAEHPHAAQQPAALEMTA